MQVAGRVEEIKLLQSLIDSDSSEFLAVYGRRRIGKTYLIRQVFEKYKVFEGSGLHEKDMAQQLENFCLSLSHTSTTKKTISLKTWLQAFSLLKKQINAIKHKQKKVIFLDEIAWFETPKSGFLAALDNFWNQYCSQRTDIVLVICGSAASWILNHVVNNRGGLHNRITSHLELMPFTLKETKQFLEMKNVKLAFKDLVTLYMAVGGVPYYLKDIKPGKSVPQLLDTLFFKSTAVLKNEFHNLYASLFKNSNLHVSVIKALAKKNKGLTRKELLMATKLSSGGGFSVVLNELVSCGFIKIINPIDKTKEDFLYRLVDEYSIFYFKFLENSKTNNSWLQLTNTQAYKIWCGYAFENICFKHITEIKKALGINGIISNDYSWINKGSGSSKGTQIDFIIDRNDNCINILELKFHTSIFDMSKSYANQLNERMHLFIQKTKSRKNVFITLLTANGSKKNEHYLSTITNELTINDLF